MQGTGLFSSISRSSNYGGAGRRPAQAANTKKAEVSDRFQEVGWSTPEAVGETANSTNTGEPADDGFGYVEGGLSDPSKRRSRSGKGSIGKSIPTTLRPSCRPLHNTIGNRHFKTSKQTTKQEDKQYLKLGLAKATATNHKNYACRRTHKPRIQYHDHDSVEVHIDKNSCALCAMGFPLREKQSDELEQTDQGTPQNDFCTSLRDALPDFSPEKEEFAARPLPLEQLSYVRLTGGPTGTDSLTTTSSCQQCGYTLDQFANLSSLNASAGWVVADIQGTICHHYDCYVKLLQDDGVCAPDWASLMALLASRGLYGYTI